MVTGGTVYILTNITRKVLYTGVTSDLYTRVLQHRDKESPKSFTARYQANILVYYDSFSTIEEAIDEEKRIKAGSRASKVKLIESMNPEWHDLFPDVEAW